MRPNARNGLLAVGSVGGVVLAPLAALRQHFATGDPYSPTASGADAGPALDVSDLSRRQSRLPFAPAGATTGAAFVAGRAGDRVEVVQDG